MRLKGFLIGLIIANIASAALGHARFRPHKPDKDDKLNFTSNTPPRNDSTGLKSAPCGGVARTTNPTVYKPGQEISVQWEETINHKGYFIIRFSEAKDLEFEKHVLVPEYVDTQDTSINSMLGESHLYATTVTLPNLECDDCTLQLIQVMTETPKDANGNLPPSAYYYSCSDIQLKSAPSSDPEVPSTGDKETQPTPTKPAKPQNVKVKKTS